MAVLDFPASPALGDKYPVPAVAGQPQYTWDGEKWTTVGAQVTTAAPASALPLMDAATALVGTATKYAREDHVHPKIPAAGLDAYAYSGMQINGSMEVSQELGTDGTGTGTKYALDGWKLSRGGVPAVTARQAVSPIFGLTNILWIAVNTAQPTLTSSDYVSVHQPIEGYRVARLAFGTANAQPVTIGFWSAHHLTGIYSVGVQNGTGVMIERYV